MYLPYLKPIYQCAQCKIIPIILKHIGVSRNFSQSVQNCFSKGYLTYYNYLDRLIIYYIFLYLNFRFYVPT